MKRINKMYGLDNIHKKGCTGGKIGVAVIDTGIFPHPDFGNRIIAFEDFVNNRPYIYDDNGHGTHVSGIIAGDGKLNAKYKGIAPGCNLIGIKVLDKNGMGNSTKLINALSWIINNREKYNIKVANISIGAKADEEYEQSQLVKMVDKAWDYGIAVIVAAGNDGPASKSITTPGISRKVITVGASDDYVQVSINGRQSHEYSGRGPTRECIKKPDVVAPGSRIVSCCPMGDRAFFSKPYTNKSGTSVSTPIVSGAVALYYGVRNKATNKDVKIAIKNTSKNLGMPHSKQGWGLLDINKLIEYNSHEYLQN